MSENKISLISTLKDLECCSRCILMLIGIEISEGILDSYLRADDKLESIERKDNEVNVKRMKRNICPSCLGILEDTTIDQFILSMSSDKFSYYQSNEFYILVNLPKCILLRIYSIFLHLREKNPEEVLDTTVYKDIFFKRIFRTAAADIISNRFNKIYKKNSKLAIDFEILYEDDETEISDLRNMKRLAFVSKNNIDDFIKSCTEKEFRAAYPVPPLLPSKLPNCRIKMKSEPLYLGGRYLKFSREMGQTPFIVNNRHITEHSVEGVLFNSIKKHLKFNGKMIFSSSGREDCDTRMLGDGRPFYIQIEDPGYYDISFQKCRKIEEEIIKTNLCAVILLQSVPMNTLRKIKEGEELKKKHYKALCHTEHPDMNQVINNINKYDNAFEIFQQTPVRVLHRRTISSRPKLIYSMNASSVPGFPQLFELSVITQAGTYVKEFVNSDFNRTKPSVTALIGYPTDVVALDVVKIELEWP